MSKARLQRGGELALAGRVLDQLHRSGPHDVAEVGLRLRTERQHDCGHRTRRPQAGQPGHAGMAVEDRAGDEDVERSLVPHLVLDVDDVGARDHLVARAERGLDGPAQCRRAADDENPSGDRHGAPSSGRCRCTGRRPATGRPAAAGPRRSTRSGSGTGASWPDPAAARGGSSRTQEHSGRRGCAEPRHSSRRCPWCSPASARLRDVEHLDVGHRQLGARRLDCGRRRVHTSSAREVRDVGVDVDVRPRLQVAGEVLGPADVDGHGVHVLGMEIAAVLAVSSVELRPGPSGPAPSGPRRSRPPSM